MATLILVLFIWEVVAGLNGFAMSALVIGGAIFAVALVVLCTDSEFVQLIKQVIDQLIRAGFGEEKILYIMKLYC